MKPWLLGVFVLLLSASSVAQEPDSVFHSIFFGGGSWYIDSDQQAELLEIVDGIPNIQYYDIYISSYTDNIGSVEMNAYLSKMRSASVIRLLQSFGLSSEAIKKKDYGESNPVFDNDTYIGKLKNRRVDILFVPLNF